MAPSSDSQEGLKPALLASDYFNGLSEAQADLLLADAQSFEFDHGELLMRQSDLDDAVFFILEGRCEVLVTQVGDESAMEVIAVIGPGEIVGERAVLSVKRRSATVRAKEPLRAIRWDASSLQAILSTHIDIGYVVMRGLARKLSDRLVTANNNLRNALTAQSMF